MGCGASTIEVSPLKPEANSGGVPEAKEETHEEFLKRYAEKARARQAGVGGAWEPKAEMTLLVQPWCSVCPPSSSHFFQELEQRKKEVAAMQEKKAEIAKQMEEATFL